MSTLAGLLEGLVSLVAPATCPACGQPRASEPGRAGAEDWPGVPGAGYDDRSPAASDWLMRGRGGRADDGDRDSAAGRSAGRADALRQPSPPCRAFCGACEPLLERAPDWLTPPARTGAGWLFVGPCADAIRRYKYGGCAENARPLGAMLAAIAEPYRSEVDAVVPMPLHPTKLRARGWNPAALLARPVAHALELPLRAGYLKRRRATRDQAGLAREARLANVRGAFGAARVTPCRILLVDDVRTTGATLAEAAATLREAGHQVSSLTLAWAPG